eukprot:scaffold123359_cov21-Phaeocystis_antarctica.AAC.1
MLPPANLTAHYPMSPQMMYLLLPFQAPAFNSAGVVATRSAAVRAPAAHMAFIDSLCAAACCPEADCGR